MEHNQIQCQHGSTEITQISIETEKTIICWSDSYTQILNAAHVAVFL